MTLYSTGTVAVEEGSATVTGTGTAFVANVAPGDLFVALGDGIPYPIASRTEDTLTLAVAYQGADASGLTYWIVPTQGRIVALTEATTQLLNEFGEVRDTAGAGIFTDDIQVWGDSTLGTDATNRTKIWGAATIAGTTPFLAFAPDLSGTTPAFIEYATATGVMRVVAGGVEAGRFDASRNWLVGATSTGFFGTVSGAMMAANGGFLATRDAWSLALSRISTDGDVTEWYRGASKVGSISVTASATSYNTSSDYRLKEDHEAVADPVARVMALTPTNFAWKATGVRVDGFIAHDLAEVVPEAVTGAKDAVEDIGTATLVTPPTYVDGVPIIGTGSTQTRTEITQANTPAGWNWAKTGERPIYQGIDQTKLVPLLTAALQVALGEIDGLKARVDALEAA